MGPVPAGPAYDPTGAGDCFGAAFIVGCLAGWPLGDRLRFANLCAALAVQEVGGSLAAPGWGDIADWWQRANARKERQGSQWLRRYCFLADIVRDVPAGGAAAGDGDHRAPLGRVGGVPEGLPGFCLRPAGHVLPLGQGRGRVSLLCPLLGVSKGHVPVAEGGHVRWWAGQADYSARNTAPRIVR